MENAQVTTYSLQTKSGRHIRTATKVTLSDGREIAFTERMSKREALRQAEALEARETIRQMLNDWNAATPEQRQQALDAAAKAAA